jgi:opacity protein-like surface antigen
MTIRWLAVLAGMGIFSTAGAQSFYAPENRANRWEFGIDLLFQDSLDIDFRGGSTADFDSSVGVRFAFGYHYSDHLQVEFALDYADIDYDAVLVSADDSDVSGRVRGTLESFTPRLNLTWNFMTGSLTPFVTGGIGYSFIDTNLPDGPPGVGCWWDPWWGYICTPYQSTRSADEFAYQVGLGIRWDVSTAFTIRGGYEKQWIDAGTARSTPDFDVFRIGFGYRY